MARCRRIPHIDSKMGTMSIYAITYSYDPERLDDIVAIRPEHRVFLRGVFEAGDLLASGPLGDTGALLIVQADSEDAALQILVDDPFNTGGLIVQTTVALWKPVFGPWSELA